jgi:diguanylate cyclase (GGDEF)-like protein
MTHPEVAARATAPSILGKTDSLATKRQRTGALTVCGLLIVATTLACIFGAHAGPRIQLLVPIAATIWSFAEFVTAFLLLAQFRVNGRRSFGILAASYAFSAFITWPYLAAFPGAFRMGTLPLGDQQISIYLWMIWRCSFPALAILAAFNDSETSRIVGRRKMHVAICVVVASPIVAVGVVTALVAAFCSKLPALVIAGHFQPLFMHVYVPAIISINALACIVLLGRGRLTGLSLWLAVTMFSEGLDSFLNLSGARYSYAWDIGKLSTVFTASVVLVMIMGDIADLFARLASVARIDVLTLLPNRRAFEEHSELVFHNARRRHESVGLLVVDIDFFKRFNDSYGHLAGDECLRAVAREMATCATRPLDLVARFGGEEFAVVLPNLYLEGVLCVGERIRSVVERLEIVHGTQALGRVTISIGAAFTPDPHSIDEATLFEIADRALYKAKERGRNRVELGKPPELAPPLQDGEPLEFAPAEALAV